MSLTIPTTSEEIIEFLRALDAGEIECPPPPDAKLIVKLCVQKSRIEKLEEECTRLHALWHDAEERANFAQIVATQKLPDELEEPDRADYEGGYEHIVKLARSTVSGKAKGAQTQSGLVAWAATVLRQCKLNVTARDLVKRVEKQEGWHSDVDGHRLKDTPEWCAFYNAVQRLDEEQTAEV